MKRVIIIDDEPPARAALRGLLREHPELTLAGEADSIAEASPLLGAGAYDVVFLDIQLQGGTGFDLVPLVQPEARIVFVTAFDHYAFRAFEVNALDFLLKPVRAARLVEALRRIATAAPETPAAPPAGASLTQGDLVYLRTGAGTTRFVALADLVVVEAEENYSAIHLASGARLFVRRTMKSWEDSLPVSHFVRVHRSTIVNLAHYRGSDRESFETMLLHFAGRARPVRASYRYFEDLRARLAALGRQV